MYVKNFRNRLIAKKIFILSFIICCIFSPVSFANAELPRNDIYKVGVNDVIKIDVLGHPDLEVIATVAVDGTISFPHLGSVYIKDMTLDEIKEVITSRLNEGYIKYPVVSVSLVRVESKKVFIHGEVARIGAVPFEKDLTVVKAIAIAGGIRENGLNGKLRIRRSLKNAAGYKNIAEVELNNGVIKDKKIEDMYLQPDDILIVERNETFLIQGEVLSRGRVVLEKNMTVLRALLGAGGVTSDGMYGVLKLRRKEGKTGGYKIYAQSKINDGLIEESAVEDILLKPDDILIVERSSTFMIKGEAAKRGKFILEKDMTILRALLDAGGITSDGLYGKVKLRRRKKEGSGRYELIAESKLNDGDIEDKDVEDILLQPDDILIVERNKSFFIYGEVKHTGEFILKHDMTVFKAITIASGFTKWGSKSKVKVLRKTKNKKGFKILKVNVKDILEGDASADIFLESGDTVVVSTGIF